MIKEKSLSGQEDHGNKRSKSEVNISGCTVSGWRESSLDPKDGKRKEIRWCNLKEGRILQPEEKLGLRRDNVLRSRR